MKAREKVRKAGLAQTASGKEAALDAFIRQLKRDGVTVSSLAAESGAGRAYLSRVFNGHGTGEHTWHKVLPLLSPAAVSLVKQCSAWNIHAEKALVWLNALRNRKVLLDVRPKAEAFLRNPDDSAFVDLVDIAQAVVDATVTLPAADAAKPLIECGPPRLEVWNPSATGHFAPH